MSDEMTETTTAHGAVETDGMSANVPKCPSFEDDVDEPLDRLSDKQLAAINLLAIGKTNVAAALAIERTSKTIARWKKQKLFRQTLKKRRHELWDSLASRMQSLGHPALDIIEKQMKDRFDVSRFQAATTLLRMLDLKKRPVMDEGDDEG